MHGFHATRWMAIAAACSLLLGITGCQQLAALTGRDSAKPKASQPAAKQPPENVPTPFEVKRVIGNNTLVVLTPLDRELTVKLNCIETPIYPQSQKQLQSTDPVDLNQFSWGKKTRDRLVQLLQKGKNKVDLNIHPATETTPAKADVLLPDGNLLQLTLVEEGLAVPTTEVIDGKAKDCPIVGPLLGARATAQYGRTNIWSDSMFLMPDVYHRRNTPAPSLEKLGVRPAVVTPPNAAGGRRR